MTIEEIRKGAPRRANKAIVYNNGDVVYLRSCDFIEYYYEGVWYQCDNVYYVNFTTDMKCIIEI